MFTVLFEVHPKAERYDDYLGYAKLLRPELERIDGFVANVRYRSLSRDGWLLSRSDWRDEKALVRWRTQALHHGVQEKGRFEVFADYRLRVGERVRDPDGAMPPPQRLDATAAGDATVVTLLDGRTGTADAAGVARALGVDPGAPGLVGWDAFDALLSPGDQVVLAAWRDDVAADAFERELPATVCVSRIRVIRDYGMRDRREAPQYYPPVDGGR